MYGATINGNELIWSIPQASSEALLQVCCFGATITSSYLNYISNIAYVSADSVSETSSNIEYIFHPTKTATPTITPTITKTPTPTITKTVTPTSTSTPTITPTPTITNTITSSITQTITPTMTSTPTITPTIIPVILGLTGIFPNPSRVESNIIFYLSRNNPVEIRIYTVSGELVLTKKKLMDIREKIDFYGI